jgi:hypothetical protein
MALGHLNTTTSFTAPWNSVLGVRLINRITPLGMSPHAGHA